VIGKTIGGSTIFAAIAHAHYIGGGKGESKLA
jgi:hypothetical protein